MKSLTVLILSLFMHKVSAIDNLFYNPEFEVALCDSLVEHQNTKGPGHKGWSIPGQEEIMQFAHNNWEKNDMSCTIREFGEISFIVDFTFDGYLQTMEPWPVSNYEAWHKVDASAECLISSQYEWVCLYKSTNFDIKYKHEYRYPGNMHLISSFIDTNYQNIWQENYLEVFTKIANDMY